MENLQIEATRVSEIGSI